MCFRSGSTSLFFYISQTTLCHLLLTTLLLMENRLLTSTRATLIIRIGAYFLPKRQPVAHTSQTHLVNINFNGQLVCFQKNNLLNKQLFS